ncbi:MAG TPA: T9SS type A sorting domain-containing protein, partial [Cytophagaceae bacterium]|nr:T9SS type A sorting domain-containing protein [Cytophagaceae bacterium]
GIKERGINAWTGACTGNVIINNYIGVDKNGTVAVPNLNEGIYVNTGTDFGGSKIGGSTSDSVNVISGNGTNGINLNTSANCRIRGNFIGVSVTGNVAIGNGNFGIIMNTCNGTRIGDAVTGAGNIISGNSWDGIYVISSTDCIIKGNMIGMGANGTSLIPNSAGVNVLTNSHRVVIGGTTAVERNIVSGNNATGIKITDSNNGIVAGNYIGLDATGNTKAANQGNGIYLFNAQITTIGGAVAGAGNVVSGNLWDGIYISGSNDCLVKGNILGLGADGTTAIANPSFQDMVKLLNRSLRTIIGGKTSAERNIISSSGSAGISMLEASDYTLVEGNYIGLDNTGLLPRGNTYAGIYMDSCKYVTIGGTTVKSRNIISANTDNGISVYHKSYHATIKGNFIGVDMNGAGSVAMGNHQQGIFFNTNSDTCMVGGSTLAERNVCSQNGDHISPNGSGTTGDGIRVVASNAITIKGNWCGTDSTGLVKMGNVWAGISLNEADGCIVGGIGQYERNIAAGNLNEGIYFRNATNTKLINNYVGVGADGVTQIGNEDFGINIRNTVPLFSHNNVIGGTGAYANVIAYNRSSISPLAPGVYVDSAATKNEITFNKIYCNGGIGIQLYKTANESVPVPVVTSTSANTISGTGVTGDSIHIYNNIKVGGDCDCEGEVYIGKVIVTGGAWSLTHGLGLTQSQADRLTATQTTPNKSTSQFSICNNPLPVQLLYLNAYLTNDNEVLITWETASEKDNQYFIIQRKGEDGSFYDIGVVPGKGTLDNLSSYVYTDGTPLPGNNYYRLKQVDKNGEFTYSGIRIVAFEDNIISIYPNPVKDQFTIRYSDAVTIEDISITDILGRIVFESRDNISDKGSSTIHVHVNNLATGAYFVHIKKKNDLPFVQKILIGND